MKNLNYIICGIFMDSVCRLFRENQSLLSSLGLSVLLSISKIDAISPYANWNHFHLNRIVAFALFLKFHHRASKFLHAHKCIQTSSLLPIIKQECSVSFSFSGFEINVVFLSDFLSFVYVNNEGVIGGDYKLGRILVWE